MTIEELVRAGANPSCVECGAKPYGGGMRCIPCFQARVQQKNGEHLFDRPPDTGTYAGGCRCRGCKRASAEYTRARRARAA